MKKFGKTLMVFATLLVALVGAFALAACGGKGGGEVKGTEGKYTVQVLDADGKAFTEVSVQVCAVDEDGEQTFCDPNFVVVNNKGVAVIDALEGPEYSAWEGETIETVAAHLFTKDGSKKLEEEGYTYEAALVRLGGVITITVTSAN